MCIGAGRRRCHGGGLGRAGRLLHESGVGGGGQLASVLGLFVAVAGLGVAVCGLIAERRSDGVGQRATTTGRGRVSQAGRDINETPPERPVDSCETAAGAASDEPRFVRQQAKATGTGQVYQAGRDIQKQ